MWGIIIPAIFMILCHNALSLRHGWHRNWGHDFHGHGLSREDGMPYNRPGFSDTNGPHFFPRHPHYWGHGPHNHGSSSHEHFSTENKSSKESGMVNSRQGPHEIYSSKFFPHHPYHWGHGPHNHDSSSHEHFSTENRNSKESGIVNSRPSSQENHSPEFFPHHPYHWGHGPHNHDSSSHEHFSTENKNSKESGIVNSRPSSQENHSPEFFPRHPHHWGHGPHNHDSSSHEHFSTENKNSKESGIINSRPSSQQNHSPEFFPHHPHHWGHGPHSHGSFDHKDSSSRDGSSEERNVPNIGGPDSHEMNSAESLPHHKHHRCHYYHHYLKCHYYGNYNIIPTTTTTPELPTKELTTEPTTEIITKPTTKFTTESTTVSKIESIAESTTVSTTESATESAIDPKEKRTVNTITTTESTIETTTDINQVFSNCIRLCPVTAEYNPVCGTNFVTYPNRGSLICAQRCGLDVKILMSSACPRNILQTSSTSQSPLTTNIPQSFSTSPSPTTNIPQSSLTIQSLLTTTTAKVNTKTPSETQSQQECIKSCDSSTESRPVCGSNDVTYKNGQHLMCAQFCGVDVKLKSVLPCTGVSTEPAITSTTVRDRDTDWYLGSNIPNYTKYCIKGCPVTLDSNPVCGTDDVTYKNPSVVQCLIICGINVQIKHKQPCPSENNTVKVVSTTPSHLPSTTAQNKSSEEICIDECVKNSEYKPVCGSNNVTYRNVDHLHCAKSCQVNVELVTFVACQEASVVPETTSSENLGNVLTTSTTSAPEFTNGPKDQNVTDQNPTTTKAVEVQLRNSALF